MYLLTQSKNGICALELSRQIGASYNATWRVKHKLMQVMLERGSIKRLSGRVQIDDSYLGGKRVSGKRGRGAKNKTPFVAAVETREEKPRRIKLSKVKGFRLDEIERWSRHHLFHYVFKMALIQGQLVSCRIADLFAAIIDKPRSACSVAASRESKTRFAKWSLRSTFHICSAGFNSGE